jgi:hypothetical protein
MTVNDSVEWQCCPALPESANCPLRNAYSWPAPLLFSDRTTDGGGSAVWLRAPPPPLKMPTDVAPSRKSPSLGP